ncbi:MAG TPA: hypothetical protein DCY55_03350 [Gammaproteobacteria bacterium]|nr:hypothetical protein [Gammaproteobacteria bacterium]
MKLNPFKKRSATPTQPLFHVTHAKAGSSWIYSILKKVYKNSVQPRVGRDYQSFESVENGIYSALFLDYDEFSSLEFGKEAPCFFIMRDIRDTLVSLYFSHRYSHVENEKVKQARRNMKNMTDEEGMLYIFENNWEKFAQIQLSWVRSGKPVYRYEDLFLSQGKFLEEILDAIHFEVPKQLLCQAIEANAFEAKFKRKPTEVDIYSHGRTGLPGDWQNHLTEELSGFIDKRLAPVIRETGYEL